MTLYKRFALLKFKVKKLFKFFRFKSKVTKEPKETTINDIYSQEKGKTELVKSVTSNTDLISEGELYYVYSEQETVHFYKSLHDAYLKGKDFYKRHHIDISIGQVFGIEMSLLDGNILEYWSTVYNEFKNRPSGNRLVLPPKETNSSTPTGSLVVSGGIGISNNLTETTYVDRSAGSRIFITPEIKIGSKVPVK